MTDSKMSSSSKNTKTSAVSLTEENLQTVIQIIVENLDDSLLTTYWRRKNQDNNPMAGYCYYASAVLQKVFPELEIWRAEDELGEYHWFNKWGDRVIDITEDQYYCKGRTPPHDTGIKKRQLGGRHGIKANKLLENINSNYEIFQPITQRP